MASIGEHLTTVIERAAQVARVSRRLKLAGDLDPLTPQELDMLAGLQAQGPQTDEYLHDAVSLARWIDSNH